MEELEVLFAQGGTKNATEAHPHSKQASTGLYELPFHFARSFCLLEVALPVTGLRSPASTTD